MSDLKEYLEDLHSLSEVRGQAKDLREQGLRWLRIINNTSVEDGDTVRIEIASPKDGNLSSEEKKRLERSWTCSGNQIEVALLVKVQNHRNYSQHEELNDTANASANLTNRLLDIDLRMLLPFHKKQDPDATVPVKQDPDATVPVLLAARTLQALTARPESALSKASMLCYYRIVRELYYASMPDWTIGAARAGSGGRISAFVTSECIRAVFAFESVIRRTRDYFQHTLELYKSYLRLETMLRDSGVDPGASHPLSQWADKAIERMWLDWYISVSPRNGTIALYIEDDGNTVLPFPPRQIEPPEISMLSVRDAFLTLKDSLLKAVAIAYSNIESVRNEIIDYREGESDDSKDRTESAYRIAFKVINRIYLNAVAIKERSAPLNPTVAEANGWIALNIRELLEYLFDNTRGFRMKYIGRLNPPRDLYVLYLTASWQ